MRFGVAKTLNKYLIKDYTIPHILQIFNQKYVMSEKRQYV